MISGAAGSGTRALMTDPARAERLWLAMAVATLWVVSVGGEADATLPASSLEVLSPNHVARRQAKHQRPRRVVSCFRRGSLLIEATLLLGRTIPLGQFLPEPWPGKQPSPAQAHSTRRQTRTRKLSP
jgi:hypothetical protein